MLRRLRSFTNATDEQILAQQFTLREVQLALAMEYGFASWDALKHHVESLSGAPPEAQDDAAAAWPRGALRRDSGHKMNICHGSPVSLGEWFNKKGHKP